MFKYFLSQLTQMSTWFGIFVILFSVFTPRSWIFLLGVVMIFLKDDAVKAFIAARAPTISKWIEDIVDDVI